ncbi:NUDIX hydrolase [Knoellia locipacati]|uniref:NUDIX hydrolase n=1 Tax=Knoellia locipacati TaxID=882824 RepID=A0A512T1W2_9MICO|nr:NUDIX hydrolase [Knoellia locipacati]GEQ14196.1 NUDIX hydrolase [Knoellia locipacati]
MTERPATTAQGQGAATDSRGGPEVDVVRAFAHLHADAVQVLGAWSAPDAEQERLRTAYLAHLERHPDGVAKAGPPEHLTASCLVITPDGREVLLTHHRRARAWFQFGGHLEATDAGLHAAATREGREESGIATLDVDPVIVQLDRHTLSGDFGRCRAHLDVRYAAVVDRAVVPATSEESLDVAWWPVDALPKDTRTELSALVEATRRALRL